MKNSKLRSICFCLLLMASLGSYAYISSVQVPKCDVKCEKQQLLNSEEDSASELPDVKLFNKLIEKGKELLPSSQSSIY